MKPPTGGAGGSGSERPGRARRPRRARAPCAVGTPGVGTPGGGHGVLVSTLASSGGRCGPRGDSPRTTRDRPETFQRERQKSVAVVRENRANPRYGRRQRRVRSRPRPGGPKRDTRGRVKIRTRAKMLVHPRRIREEASRRVERARVGRVGGGGDERAPRLRRRIRAARACARAIASKSAPGAACRGSIPRALGFRLGFTFGRRRRPRTPTPLCLCDRGAGFRLFRPARVRRLRLQLRLGGAPRRRVGWARTNAARLTATS